MKGRRTDFPAGGRCVVGVSTFAVGLIGGGHDGYVGELRGAGGSEIGVDAPGLAEVRALLDDHSLRPEGAELHDQVREDELSFQIQLDGDVLAIVLGLPPGLRVFIQISRRTSDDLIDGVGLVRHFHVAHVTTDILQIADETVAFRATQTTRGAGVEIRRPTDQQVARRRITSAVITIGIRRATSERTARR